MSFDVWKFLLIFGAILFTTCGKPASRNAKINSSITKRVEILGATKYNRNQNSVRRHNVIHAGSDYDTDKTVNEPEPDELENLGKIIDYNGKVIESAKSAEKKWKDTPGISKDVIERIKQIQDTLIKRTGGKGLAERLKLMQPESNVTVTSGTTPVNSRKVIPEDVVNKILAKFQELREQAKNLASLDENKGKVDGKESSEKTTSSGDAKSDKNDSETNSSEKTKQGNQQGSQKSPYESIGPPKENEELRNATQSTVTEVGPDAVKPNEGPSNEVPERTNPQAVPTPGSIENGQQNTRNGMMMNGKVPMMFIKQGEMLVPVFGNQDGSSQGFQRSTSSAVPTPQMMANMGLIPQGSATQMGQSRSGAPQSFNPQNVEIPSVPYSTIMSLMSGPQMISNLPANPPQMNGVYNVPQGPMMNQAGFAPQYGGLNAMSGPAGPDSTGMGRQMLPEPQGQFPGPGGPPEGMPLSEPQRGPMSFNNQLSDFQRQVSPFQEQGSPFEERPRQEMPSFMGGLGGFRGQPTAMGRPGLNGEFGLAMDPSGKISPVNPSSTGLMPAQPMGPLAGNPFQDTHPEARNNMELMNKENQMLNPYMSNPVNDLSDPNPNGNVQGNARSLNPDALLELARFHKPEPDMPTNVGNPDNLLDNLRQGQLNRELTGPGDPERIGVNGMMSRPVADPFAGTNPESLLDMLSKRNSKQIWSKNTMEMEREAQNREMATQRLDQGLRRGSITQIGTNGMQGISSLPGLGQTGLDPSFADYTGMVGNQPMDVGLKSSALNNPVESTFFGSARMNQGSRYHPRQNKLDILSQNTLRFENSRNAIDSGDDNTPINQADIYARHKIPDLTASKRTINPSPTLQKNNIELRVNGQPLAETGSLRSKIVDGKVQKGQGKTLTSKSPVKIELSHSDDAKKTKIINIVTTGKYKVSDSKRNNVLKTLKLLRNVSNGRKTA
eukprot:gene17689-19457_t